MGNGRTIEVTVNNKTVTVRDFGHWNSPQKHSRCGIQNEYRGQNTIQSFIKICWIEQGRIKSSKHPILIFSIQVFKWRNIENRIFLAEKSPQNNGVLKIKGQIRTV